MYYYSPYWFFGMHAIWWLFWILALALLFSFAVPVRRSQWRELKDAAPLAILQRRFAAGELSTEEYEARKAIIERDSRPTVNGDSRVTPPVEGNPRHV